jgi:hypothetical protein
MHPQNRHPPDLDAAASRKFTALFDKVKYAPPHTNLARDIDMAMRELAAFCDEAFAPTHTHELHAEMRDLVASMQRHDFVCPERLAQFAQLRARVEGLWTSSGYFAPRSKNVNALTPLQHEYARVLLRLDLALVRFKVQVLLLQLECA